MARRKPRTQKQGDQGQMVIPVEHPGRPPSITPQSMERLVAAISSGLPINMACVFSGIGKDSHTRALRAGRDAQAAWDRGENIDDRQELYRTYAQRVEAARAQLMVRNISVINKVAAGGQLVSEEVTESERYDDEGRLLKTRTTAKKYTTPDWRAARWLLEKSFPADFHQPNQLELSGPGGGPMEHSHAATDAVVITALSERLAEIAERNRREIAAGEIDEHGAPILDGDAEVIEGEVMER